MSEHITSLDFTNLPAELELALGKVTARSGQIEHLLVVTLKRTDGRDWQDVFADSEGKKGKERRHEAKESFSKWARGKFSASEAKHRIQEFENAVNRIGQIASLRNLAVHSAWGVDAKRELYATNKGRLLRNNAGDPFRVTDVEKIAADLHQSLYIINAATDPNQVTPKPERDESGSIIVPKDFVVSSSASAVVTPPMIHNVRD